jgi:eukaryotic translation initiation factor 2C
LNLGKHVNSSTKEGEDFDSMKAILQDLKTESVDLLVVLRPDKDANTYATLERAAGVAVGIQTHPGSGALAGTPNIAALVANKDDNFAQWTTSVRTQLPFDESKNSIEQIVDLKDMVVEPLEAWRRHHNGKLPEKLIVYRDRVSESQFATVRCKETPSIDAATSKLYDDLYGNDDSKKHPLLLVLCTIKRHHTRSFPVEGSSDSVRDSAGNPQPGCVVDSNVTLQNLDNLYLQSHAAIVGTARSTHYVILHNSHQTSIKDIQKMTFNLCYLYGRSVSSVGLVPAAYYADVRHKYG